MRYTQSELDIVQERWRLRFPDDLLALLLEEGPLLRGVAHFDWRTTDPETIQNMLDWPFESFWFDVVNPGCKLDTNQALDFSPAACVKEARMPALKDEDV
jgi:hypothetical protein